LKVCIVGAGAIGGFIGTRLALEGSARVSALARGTTLVPPPGRKPNGTCPAAPFTASL